MFNFVTKILGKKFTFKFLKKKDLLIFDFYSLRDLKRNVKIKNYEVLDYRHEINLVVVLKMLLNFKFSKKFYFYYYLKKIHPKIIITTIDNNLNFYQLKDIYPSCKTVLVQTAYQHNKYGDNFYLLKKNKKVKKFSVDYIFCISSGFAELYKRYLKYKKIFVTGSLRNNYPVKANKNKKKIISYISQYRSRGKWNEVFYKFKNKSILKRDFYNLEIKLIPIIAQYCKKNNFDFKIIGSSLDFSEEKNFYQKLIGTNKWSMLIRDKNDIYRTNGYKYISQSTINIFAESTLGFESLGKGIKTISFFARKSLNDKKVYFGWPSQKKPKGFIWTNEVTKKEFNRLINNVLPLRKKSWDYYRKSKLKDIIAFDNNNSNLKNFLKNNL